VATARFQAAAAIREAAIREWVFLGADVKRNLIRSSITSDSINFCVDIYIISGLVHTVYNKHLFDVPNSSCSIHYQKVVTIYSITLVKPLNLTPR